MQRMPLTSVMIALYAAGYMRKNCFSVIRQQRQTARIVLSKLIYIPSDYFLKNVNDLSMLCNKL